MLIGTYADVGEARDVELKLLAARLPVYAIDVLFPPADVRRRLVLGRYRTASEAQAVRAGLSGTVPDAIVILGWQERLRKMGNSTPVPYSDEQ